MRVSNLNHCTDLTHMLWMLFQYALDRTLRTLNISQVISLHRRCLLKAFFYNYSFYSYMVTSAGQSYIIAVCFSDFFFDMIKDSRNRRESGNICYQQRETWEVIETLTSRNKGKDPDTRWTVVLPNQCTTDFIKPVSIINL